MNKMEKKTIEEILSVGNALVWDLSALCSAGFKKYIQSNFHVIQRNREKFIVPEFIKNELIGSGGEPALMVIERGFFYVQDGISNYLDMMRYFKDRGISNINVFVNDPDIRLQIIKEAKSVGIYIYFYKVIGDGTIEVFKSIKKENIRSQQETSRKQNKKRVHGFAIKSQPERCEFKVLSVEREIGVGAKVVGTDGTVYSLEKQEVTNNNAITYSTNQIGIWIKIFNKNALNTYTQAKIERMLTQTIKCEGLCWPLDIVKDSNGVFRGYALNEFKGVPLHLCVFKRAGIDSYFPKWTKIDLCELTETILKKVEFLHKHNILFGCINPAAIRVVDKNEVYFTDTDNYQIDGFPTMVHNISFTAPELLGKKVYLATKQNENFAIAELVFMLMMPGKTPYAVGGEETPEELIQNMKFPYSNGQIHGNNALPGMWRFMWSHLSSLKGSFYNVFQTGGKYNKQEERQDVFYWEKAISYFKNELQNPDDKESLKIYPRTFKRSRNELFYKCNYCGVEHPRFYFFNQYFDEFRICNGCIDKMSDVSFTCKACGKTYYYTNRTALYHKTMKKQDSEWKDQKYCRDCKKKTVSCRMCGKEWPYYHLKNGRCPDCNQEYGKSIYKWIMCRDCGRQFEFTVKEHEFFRQKGYSEPTRCPDCRNRRKNGGNPVNTYGSSNVNSSRKKGGFFSLFGF